MTIYIQNYNSIYLLAKSSLPNQQINIVEEEVIAEDYDSNRKDIDEYGFESIELKFKVIDKIKWIL